MVGHTKFWCFNWSVQEIVYTSGSLSAIAQVTELNPTNFTEQARKVAAVLAPIMNDYVQCKFIQYMYNWQPKYRNPGTSIPCYRYSAITLCFKKSKGASTATT